MTETTKFLNCLKEIITIFDRYNFVESKSFSEKLNTAYSSEMVANILINKTHDGLEPYKSVLEKKNYAYLDTHKIDIGYKDINDFIEIAWKDFVMEDKKRIFRLLSKMYNYSLSHV